MEGRVSARRSLHRLALGLLAALVLAGCADSPRRQLKHLIAQQQQADQAYARGDMDAALRGYQALTAAMPAQAGYWFRLGNVRAKLGQPDAAVAAYAHALRLDPQDREAWYNLGIVRLRMAEAAFVQAAQYGKPGDALRRHSAALADGLARLADKPPAHGHIAPAQPVAGSGS